MRRSSLRPAAAGIAALTASLVLAACQGSDAVTAPHIPTLGPAAPSFASSLAPAQHNIVVNGSFEQGNFSLANYSWEDVCSSSWGGPCSGRALGPNAITGWTVDGIVNWHDGAEFNPIEDGGRAVDLSNSGFCGGGGHGTISQTLSTTPGALYTLSFYVAGPMNFGDPCSGIPIRHIAATINGSTTTFAVSASDHFNLSWELKQVSFNASGSSTVLAFSPPEGDANGYWGPVLDNVSVVQVLPTDKSQCKDGGWQSFGVFKNQGDCVSFVATSGLNPPG